MAATAENIEGSTDPGRLEAWIQRLPADPCGAFGALRAQVEGLPSNPAAPNERLAMLERMRSHALDLLPEVRSRYLGKPVPPEPAEREAWESCFGLWQAFYFGYALCMEAGSEEQGTAFVWQRALDCLGRAIRECPFGYRAVPAGLWKELSSCYRSAEGCALIDVPVAEGDRAAQVPDCKRAFLVTVLHEAANLYSLSTSQMVVLEQLLPAWASICEITVENPLDAARSPLAIDLAADAGAQLARSLEPADTVRFLDTSRLASRLRELAAAVRSGSLPIELAAARALPRPAIERLLTHLYIQWCSGGTGRMEERRDAARRAQVALNMHAIHFQISGRAFRQPGTRYTREEEHDLATFGHITERTEQRLLTSQSSAQEPWEIVNQSASGVLSMMRKPDLESRVQHGQLIAMRVTSMDPPMLASVQRLRIDSDGGLGIGVRAIRGEARGAAVRALGDPGLKYERALLVEADAEHAAPAFLILPPGMFAVGSLLELHTGRAEKIAITAMIEQSIDHDRATYAPAS